MTAGRKQLFRMNMHRRRVLEAFMFLTPWLIGLCLFFVYPIFVSVKLSFSEIVKFKGFIMEPVGLDNYKHIFFYDINFMPTFIEVVYDTLLNTPISLVFSLVIAIFINGKMKGRAFFRATFFIPVLLGSGYVMKQLLGLGVDGMSVTAGITVPKVISDLIGTTVSDVVQTFLDRITVVLWKSGVQIVLFLAGLQGIPGSLYEAARVDGATEWEMFWKITLPMITPVILINLVYTVVSFFTDGTNPIVDYIHEQGFKNMQFAHAAAMGWVYFAFTFLICMLCFAFMRKRTFNLGGKE